MKKIVAFTTVILLLLVGILGFMFMHNKMSVSGMSISKEKLLAEVSPDENEYYQDALLYKMNTRSEIVYEGKTFKVKFLNPFYGESEDTQLIFIFYNENYGYMLKSIGNGQDSMFFESYKTEDGGQIWTKCAEDLWFDLNGQNSIEMISEQELVYVCTTPHKISGEMTTTISYTKDGGDDWIIYEDPNMSAEDQVLIDEISEMTIKEKVAQMFIVTPEDLTEYELVTNAGQATYDVLKKYPVGGILYDAKNYESSYQFDTMLENVQYYAMELSEPPVFIAATEALSGVLETELFDQEDIDMVIIPKEAAISAGLEDNTIQTASSLNKTFEFESLILTDFVSEVKSEQSEKELVVQLIKDGADMIVAPTNFRKDYKAVLSAVESGELSEADIDHAVYHILKVKKEIDNQDVVSE